MQINNNKSTSQIKEEFNILFENLKIEFFSSSHQAKEGSHESQKIKENLHLSSIRNNSNEGEFLISPEMSITELEQAFEQNFGIYIQVYRKSGDIWLQTTSTDDWSLSKQNTIGARELYT